MRVNSLPTPETTGVSASKTSATISIIGLRTEREETRGKKPGKRMKWITEEL